MNAKRRSHLINLNRFLANTVWSTEEAVAAMHGD